MLSLQLGDEGNPRVRACACVCMRVRAAVMEAVKAEMRFQLLRVSAKDSAAAAARLRHQLSFTQHNRITVQEDGILETGF